MCIYIQVCIYRYRERDVHIHKPTEQRTSQHHLNSRGHREIPGPGAAQWGTAGLCPGANRWGTPADMWGNEAAKTNGDLSKTMGESYGTYLELIWNYRILEGNEVLKGFNDDPTSAIL